MRRDNDTREQRKKEQNDGMDKARREKRKENLETEKRRR